MPFIILTTHLISSHRRPNCSSLEERWRSSASILARAERYQYEYFEGALDLDLNRYPSFGQIVDGMGQVGLGNVEMRVVDAYDVSFVGEEIYRDPFLEKPSNSLMALLTDEVYAKGLKNIAEAIAADPLVRFRSKVDFTMITGVR